ncbi:purine catabolism regulator [Nocardia sp. GAS34]|uniref:PucR family transcriptional regulator n=1 Tax=unclassified Nocardia TaxID=2637762 RepID=UPI003D21111B
MAITIGELTEIPHLRLEVHSGAAGLGREVAWTHVTDLPEPWRWVTGGEFLMTNGMSFPKSAKAQADLVRQLAAKGVAGLGIGENMYCPPLTRAVSRISDELGFPLLWIRYPLPFVAISRAVAEATLVDQSQRLSRTVRMYDLIRRHTAHGADPATVLSALARELGCEIQVCERATGEPWFPDTPPLDPTVSDAIAALSDSSKNVAGGAYGLPSIGDRAAMLTDIPRHADAALVALSDPKVGVDPIQLQHAATVVSIELSQTRLMLEHERRYKSGLLTQMLEGRMDIPAAADQLAELGLDPASAVLVVARSDDPNRMLDLHNSLWRRSLPNLCRLRMDTAHVLVPDDTHTDAVLIRALGPTARIGVSGKIGSLSRFQDAAREASWALSIAERQGTVVSRYGSAVPWIGLSDVAEAQTLVDRILRPVLDYDEKHQSQLVETLDIFLQNQRSWQRTAQAMHIHRQTVMYRIRKVEALTDRDVADTNALAELWLAVRAAELLSFSRTETTPSRRLK